jgi:predicted secreted protein
VEWLIFFSKITNDPEQFITSNDEEQMNKVQEERAFLLTAVNETETDLSWSLFSLQETDCKEYSSDH